MNIIQIVNNFLICFIIAKIVEDALLQIEDFMCDKYDYTREEYLYNIDKNQNDE